MCFCVMSEKKQNISLTLGASFQSENSFWQVKKINSANTPDTAGAICNVPSGRPGATTTHHLSPEEVNTAPLQHPSQTPRAAFFLRQPAPVLQGELRLHHQERAASRNSTELLNRSRCSTPLLTRSQDPEEIQFPSAKSTVSNSCEYPLCPF